MLGRVMGRNQVDEMKDVNLGVDKPSNNAVYMLTLGSILLSLAVLPKSTKGAIFTGLWAPTILGLGIMLKENQILNLERKLLAKSK